MVAASTIAERPYHWLRVCERAYSPRVWRVIDRAREKYLTDTDTPWAPWCYIPASIATGAIDTLVDPPAPRDAPGRNPWIVHALASWRMGKPIYQFDPTLYDMLLGTPITDVVLPAEIFTRLPHWGVYLCTPGMMFSEAPGTPAVPLRGVFATLDATPYGVLRQVVDPTLLAAMQRPTFDSLTLVLDCESRHGQEPAALVAAVALNEEVERGLLTATRTMWATTMLHAMGADRFQHVIQQVFSAKREARLAYWAPQLAPLLSLILYLCSDEPDVMAMHPPEPAAPRQGRKLIAAHNITEWMVGARVGAALRVGKPANREGEPGRTTPGSYPLVRPHMRRAHWHTYWMGPRSAPDHRVPVLRWIPPTPVAVQWEDVAKLPADTHRVTLWDDLGQPTHSH